MTRITNADHVLAQLRARFDRLARSRAGVKAGGPARAGGVSRRVLERMRALSPDAGLGTEELARVLVDGLLTERFGEPLAAEPRFQALVDEVAGLMLEDPEARALIQSALAGLER